MPLGADGGACGSTGGGAESAATTYFDAARAPVVSIAFSVSIADGGRCALGGDATTLGSASTTDAGLGACVTCGAGAGAGEGGSCLGIGAASS